MNFPLQARSPLVLALTGLFPLASMASNTQDYAIPPGALGNALNRLAAVDGWQIVYDAALAEHQSSPGVQGRHTREEALNLLLAAAPLQAKVVGDNTVALEPAAKPAGTPVSGAEQQPHSGPVSLGTVEVSDSYAHPRYQAEQELRQRYYIPRSTTATKTDTPIMETPMSIQVVPRQVMDDQQVIDIKDAVKNVSGVQSADDFYVNFNIRGFDTNNNIYRNGLRLTNLSALETANLSQVEVLKGPAAVLFGRLQPGGLVNLVTKRPLDQPYYSVQQQFGSYNLYRTTVDATGPVLDDGSLLYRANIAYRSNDSFRDFVSQENLLVAPSLTWRPIDPLEVNLDFEYQHYSFVQDGGIPAVGNRPAQIPISRYLDDRWSQYNPSTQDRYLAGQSHQASV